MRKPRYVTLSRDLGWGDYDLWTDVWGLEQYGESWRKLGYGGRHLKRFCGNDWHHYTGLRLRKGTKRRVKITYLKNGCKWEWAGKGKK